MGLIVIRRGCLCGLVIKCTYDIIIDIEGLHVVKDTSCKKKLVSFWLASNKPSFFMIE